MEWMKVEYPTSLQTICAVSKDFENRNTGYNHILSFTPLNLILIHTRTHMPTPLHVPTQTLSHIKEKVTVSSTHGRMHGHTDGRAL